MLCGVVAYVSFCRETYLLDPRKFMLGIRPIAAIDKENCKNQSIALLHALRMQEGFENGGTRRSKGYHPTTKNLKSSKRSGACTHMTHRAHAKESHFKI